MFKSRFGWLMGCALLWFGCSASPESERPSETDEIVANLEQAGFPRDDIQLVDGLVYVGGDAVVSLQASREMVAVDADDSREHYRTTNLVEPWIRRICIYDSSLPTAISNALDRAIINYNDLGLRFTLKRSTVVGECEGVIFVHTMAGRGGESGFPAEGRPYRDIYIGTDTPSAGVNVPEHVITHELGHTIGLRHTDFYNRSISCGGRFVDDEGAGPPGAIYIPGTPTEVLRGASLMNACYDTDVSGDFALSDAIAIRALYLDPVRPSTAWTSGFADAAWKSSESYWGTIAYPDVNGDGFDDICGRSADGIQCALSEGGTFGAPSLWTTGFSDAGGWKSSESYWRTISYPDVNGDHLDDVCGRGANGVTCAISKRYYFENPTYWTSAYSDVEGWNLSPSNWRTISYPDLNLDGRKDICGRASGGIYCGVSNGSSFGGMSYWSSAFSDADGWNGSESYWATISFADVDGDRRDDVCGRGSAGISCARVPPVPIPTRFDPLTLWTSSYSDAAGWGTSEMYWRTIRFPDLNGDGNADVCGRAANGLYCSLSNRQSFNASSFWTSGFSNSNGWHLMPAYWQTISYPDLNNDKHADVCGRSASGMSCATSTGGAFTASALWSTDFSNYSFWPSSPAYWGTIRFPDVDKNGRADACGRTPSGIVCSR